MKNDKSSYRQAYMCLYEKIKIKIKPMFEANNKTRIKTRYLTITAYDSLCS